MNKPVQIFFIGLSIVFIIMAVIFVLQVGTTLYEPTSEFAFRFFILAILSCGISLASVKIAEVGGR